MKKRYGKLKIIEDTGKREHTSKIFLCICDCGNYKEVSINKLKTGHTKSCGCLNHAIKSYKGRRFGKLKILDEYKRINKKTYWLCRCDCGNLKFIKTDSLVDGSTKSCGCLNDKVRRDTIRNRMKFENGTSLVAISPKRKLNKNNKSGFKGVHFDTRRSRWIASITYQRRCIYIGSYININDAVTARKKAELKYFNIR